MFKEIKMHRKLVCLCAGWPRNILIKKIAVTHQSTSWCTDDVGCDVDVVDSGS